MEMKPYKISVFFHKGKYLQELASTLVNRSTRSSDKYFRKKRHNDEQKKM